MHPGALTRFRYNGENINQKSTCGKHNICDVKWKTAHQSGRIATKFNGFEYSSVLGLAGKEFENTLTKTRGTNLVKSGSLNENWNFLLFWIGNMFVYVTYLLCERKNKIVLTAFAAMPFTCRKMCTNWKQIDY